MSISFQGIGQICATFAGSAAAGQVVKVTGRGTAGPCSDGDSFCGVSLGGKDGACAVQVSGFATVAYTGTVPAMGWATLAANGTGGVKTASAGGRQVLVVDADTTAKTVTLLL